MPGYPAEAFSLQGGSDGLSGPPRQVQYTAVNIGPDPPKDHLVWSLFCFIYSNPCCLGLAALIYSVRARDRKLVGDLEGARRLGSSARCLNIWATALASVAIIVCFIFPIIMILRAKEAKFSIYSRNGGY